MTKDMAKRIGEKVIFKTKLLTIKDVDIEYNSRKVATHQIIEKKGSAIIVPINENNEVLFIREYFDAIDEYQISLPKGAIEEGHDALTTANKELQEEIGYKAGRLDELGMVTASPGYYNLKTHIFLARDLQESKLEGDEEEEFEIIKYPFEKFEDLIDEGKLTEARIITALYLARRYLKDQI